MSALKPLRQLAIASLFLLLADAARADTRLYYEIGGATPVSKPAWISRGDHRISTGGSLSWNYSCGKFDRRASVGRMLQDLRSAADEYVNQMVAAAQAAIAGLPALILQRANPGLYDLFQNGLIRFQATVDLARADCQTFERMFADVLAGNAPASPTANWQAFVQASRQQSWADELQTHPGDMVRAQERVMERDGRDGVQWVGGGRAGGQGQPAIRPIADSVAAGYNILSGRLVTDPSPGSMWASVSPGSNPRNVFPTPAEAADWVAEVIGDAEITTFEGGDRVSVRGMGLLPKLEQEQVAIDTRLRQLVTSSNPIAGLAGLEELTSSTVTIGPQVISDVRQLPMDEREMLVQRLASEIAMARTIETALVARRLLVTGRSEPYIVAIPAAVGTIDAGVAELERAIDELMFEKRVREELVSGTVRQIMARAAARREAEPGMRDDPGQVRLDADGAPLDPEPLP